MMATTRPRTKFITAGTALVAVALGSDATFAVAQHDNDDGEAPTTGDAFARASQAALAYTGASARRSRRSRKSPTRCPNSRAR